jgi:subfamily B ATP-binding cassette protein MsbA
LIVINLILTGYFGYTMDDFALLKKYFLPYRYHLIVITTLSIVCGLFEAVSLGALVPLINLIATNQEPTGNLWSLLKTILGFFQIDLNIITLLIIISIVFLFGQVIVLFKQTLQFNLRFGFVRDIKERVLNQLLYADLSYHNNKKIGHFLDSILIETERAGAGLFVITDIFSNICLITVYILMLVYISFFMTVFCIIIVFFMLLFVNILLKKSKIFGEKCVESNIEINEYATERFNLLKLIKANSTEKQESEIFSKIADRFGSINTEYMINGAKIDIVFQSIMFIVAVIIVYLSIYVLSLSFGLIAVFLFVLIRLTTPLRSVNNSRHDLTGLMASLKNVDRTLTESKDSTTVHDGNQMYEGIKEKIALRNVSFSYTPYQPVLTGITFDIRKNELVALAGQSGGGKSTLVDLLMRLIDPTGGSIEIDGTDLRSFDLKSFHAKVGIVSQDVFIFNDSVISNICYGSDEISLEKAKHAAKIAYADEFIEQLPQGYYTSLGDRGVKLSGGQKQRIALARAICKNPDILILDEATSALDTESEKIIQNSINAIKHKYTIIVVAHRLSTIQDADNIVVIEEGKIQESGSHNELISRDGTYAKYYALQHGKNGSSVTNE